MMFFKMSTQLNNVLKAIKIMTCRVFKVKNEVLRGGYDVYSLVFLG